jgi:hypothetical protein
VARPGTSQLEPCLGDAPTASPSSSRRRIAGDASSAARYGRRPGCSGLRGIGPNVSVGAGGGGRRVHDRDSAILARASVGRARLARAGGGGRPVPRAPRPRPPWVPRDRGPVAR